LLFLGPQSSDATLLKVGAFKIEVFGVTKFSKPDVVNVIKNTLIRYDIVLIQDIREANQASSNSINQLLNQVNAMGVGTWAMVLSSRLGRTTSKEQYAFFYKPSLVTVITTYQWPDTGDLFEREPFIVHFHPTSCYDVGDFAFMAIHVKPTDAVAEINQLAAVYDSVKTILNLENILIGGNFNADCTYVTASEWASIALRTDTRFMWTISDDLDSSVHSNDCSYDRIVLAGSRLQNNYLPSSGKVYYFDADQGVNETMANLVSDHYPVEIKLI
jgi:endonuclease/exonuclease/phosphatase family metal-dependent hydrolase